jgi:lipopolysaccharide/colanic/teichoic acid biosynthesis glycosyltransferase
VNLVNDGWMVPADPLVGALENKYNLRIGLYVTLILLDCALIGLAFGSVGWLGDSSWLDFQGMKLGAMVIPIFLGVAINGNSYSLQALMRPGQAAVQVAVYLFFAMLSVQCVLYFAHVSASTSRLLFGCGILISALLLAAVRRPFTRYALKRTGGNLTAELFIRDGVDLDLKPGKHVPLMVDADAHGLRPDLHDPWMLHRLGNWLRTFDRVVVACPEERRHDWSILLRGSSIQGEIITGSVESGAIGIGSFGGRETHIVSKGPLNMSNRVKKRLFDLALTLPALFLLAPLMILVAIAIKIDSRGPVLFLQERVGLGNRLFRIAKFRSMHGAEADLKGATSASRSDSRVTRVGRILRKTSIDELPQLFNVLLGQMSIVGPRPHALGSTADAKLFWQISEYYWCRHALKPGITGLAQVRGYRGATEKMADLENRLGADLEYLRDWSLTREIVIVLRTFSVLVHKNAF